MKTFLFSALILGFSLDLAAQQSPSSWEERMQEQYRIKLEEQRPVATTLVPIQAPAQTTMAHYTEAQDPESLAKQAEQAAADLEDKPENQALKAKYLETAARYRQKLGSPTNE